MSLQRAGLYYTRAFVAGPADATLEAYPEEWPITVGKVAELDFDSLVPGHGPVQHGRAMLTLFKDHLTELNQLVKEGVTDGKNLDAAIRSNSRTPSFPV